MFIPVWMRSSASLLSSFCCFQRWSSLRVLGVGVGFPVPCKGQGCVPGFVFRGSPGWAGIGRLPGSLPVPHLTRGCPEAAPRQLQLRALLVSPFLPPFLSQVGPCAFSTLKPSLKPTRAVLFSLGKSGFFPLPFIPPALGLGLQPPSWCHLSPKGQCDSGTAQSALFPVCLGKLPGVWFFRICSHLCTLIH